MPITSKISATIEAVSGADTAFTTTNRGFWLHGHGFAFGESATVMREFPSGTWGPATNETGEIAVSAFPNVIFADLPAGTYRIDKTVTAIAASVGYEEES
jgi:hypothetical protein